MKNKDCKELVKTIKRRFSTDDTENEKNVVTAMALHGIFLPSLRSSTNGRTFKPSIVDSQDSFIILTTECNVESAVDEKKQGWTLRNTREHPVIVGVCLLNEGVTLSTKRKRHSKFQYDIRDVHRIQKFCVVFGYMRLDTENFLKAFDFCFRIYKSLNIPFPESEKMWRFVDEQFYGLNESTTSKIASVVNESF